MLRVLRWWLSAGNMGLWPVIGCSTGCTHGLGGPCYGCLLDWCFSLLPNVGTVQPIDELSSRRVGGPKASPKPPSLVP